MHYYKRNIGDYAKKAGKLTMLQHGAYTLLIDACYDRERFPTLEDAMDWTWAETDEEKKAIEVVLRRFFKLVDGFYVQDRIAEELESYRALSEANSRIARQRENAKRERRVNEACKSVNESAPNHKPLTTNHKPLTNKPKNASAAVATRFDDFWNAWPAHERKQDKAKCAAKWKAEKLDSLIDQITADIAVKRRTDKWQSGYIEAPLVYLNNRRWEDGVQPQSSEPGLTDPYSRAAIEAKGVAKGYGPWDELKEQWQSYKVRVMGIAPRAPNIAQLAEMAKLKELK